MASCAISIGGSNRCNPQHRIYVFDISNFFNKYYNYKKYIFCRLTRSYE